MGLAAQDAYETEQRVQGALMQVAGSDGDFYGGDVEDSADSLIPKVSGMLDDR